MCLEEVKILWDPREEDEKAKYNQKMDPEERNILVVAYLGTCDTLETGKEECD